MKQIKRSTLFKVTATVLLSGLMFFNHGVCSEESTIPESSTVVPILVSTLTDTQWRLVEFQSMDDAIGIKRTDDPSKYTMQLNGDGTVKLRLNCNLATGTWSAEASSDLSSGQFNFGLLAATRALCPPPSMDEHVLSQAPYVRSFLLKDGRLYLSLMADGGIYVWEPDN